MGRSIYCSTCKKEKEPGRDNESRCFSCKSEAYRKNRAKKRLEKGLTPLGSGRSIYCCDCKKVKENPKVGYCLECHARRDREWRVKTGRSKKNRTGKCACGKDFAKGDRGYCPACRNAKSAAYKRAHPLTKKEDKFKKWIRFTTYTAVKRGYLEKLPCEVCGEVEKVDAHHDDYQQPLKVRWLCKQHHLEHHKNERST